MKALDLSMVWSRFPRIKSTKRRIVEAILDRLSIRPGDDWSIGVFPYEGIIRQCLNNAAVDWCQFSENEERESVA